MWLMLKIKQITHCSLYIILPHFPHFSLEQPYSGDVKQPLPTYFVNFQSVNVMYRRCYWHYFPPIHTPYLECSFFSLTISYPSFKVPETFSNSLKEHCPFEFKVNTFDWYVNYNFMMPLISLLSAVTSACFPTDVSTAYMRSRGLCTNS